MARRSKTKDRILSAALRLFNDEGEPEVTPADIAHELNISPGNLYYHYKGKEPIITALFERFDEEMRLVLSAPRHTPLEIKDNWVFFYIIFEEIYDFRFFYTNMTAILDRVPALTAPFRALVAEKARSIRTILATLRDEELIAITDAQIARLADRAAMHFTHWPAHQQLIAPELSIKTAIHDGVYGLFTQITPYMGAAANEFEALLAAFHRDMRAGTGG